MAKRFSCRVELRLVALIAVLTCSQEAVSAPRYVVTDLGTLGGTDSEAFAINDTGQIVGSSHAFGEGFAHPFVYESGTMVGFAPGNGQARDINASGQIVGWYRFPGEGVDHAFLYSQGTLTNFGNLGPGGFATLQSEAWGINDRGHVVGYFGTATFGAPIHRAFLWTGGLLGDLGTLGGTDSYATAINNLGDVVGYSRIAGNTAYHAFLYSNGLMTDLGTLGGLDSFAYSINDHGQIVGYSYVDGMQQAFLYENGSMRSFGVPGERAAIKINEVGDIVGRFGFLFRDGILHDLNDLIDLSSGWRIEQVNGINNVGQIVGSGINPEGYNHAYLLTPLATAVSAPPSLGAILTVVFAFAICLHGKDQEENHFLGRAERGHTGRGSG